jgi:hypothetical protein
LLLGAIALICIPKFYITGDGPSHVYNAQVLFDYVKGANRDFYKPFYEINRNLEPNTLSQIVLGGLMQFLPYWFAEKVFQCIYVLLFAFGFRYLLKQLNPNSSVFVLLFFPLCFTLPFQMGFYNFCLAIAILFFTIGYIIKHLQNSTINNVFSCAILLLCCTFTHGMIGSLAVFLSALIIITKNNNWKENAIHFLSICIPSILIIIAFTLRQGLNVTPHSLTKWQKFLNLSSLYANASTRFAEYFPLHLLAVLLALLLIMVLVQAKLMLNKMQLIFALFFIYLFISYINAPATLAYAGGTDIRLASLVPLFLICFLQLYDFSNSIKWIIVFASILLQLSISIIRLPYILSASAETQTVLKTISKIKPQSVLLKIQYNEHGSKNQFQVDNSFLHATDYIGATVNKPLILLNNFEAEISYFSVQWRYNRNPKFSIPAISVNKLEYFNDILKCETQIKHSINYVIWMQPAPNLKISSSAINSLGIPQQDSLYLYYNCIDSNNIYNIKLFERK